MKIAKEISSLIDVKARYEKNVPSRFRLEKLPFFNKEFNEVTLN